ncbi:uncharacterized protein EV194_10249 [Natronoflexus pectinivorans]|uniref:TPM domain-containing protein n=2 Tax=Natronoflexus pectinivorans TaxID=682526 RepID=A0A4R2GMI5_9BACT|nr:uncharacterized protein EV194_10249 [Natronoflexus pectinivorans]
MNMNKSLRCILIVLCFIGFTDLLANPIPERPVPARLVNDFAGVLPEGSRNNLENSLVQFARETSTQVAVVIVSDLGGYDAGDYAFRVADQWGIGQAGSDNGLLILVKPRIGNERGRAYIAVGYGLEGVIPDAVARRVVDNEMIPHFRNEDYYTGLIAGLNVIMDLTRDEYTADAYMSRTGSREEAVGGVVGLVIIIVMFMVISRARRTRQSSLGHDVPFWVIMSMLGSGSRRHSGQWGNFSSGRGSFSPGSGGGFGGFGGGRFGGGGAGGSW